MSGGDWKGIINQILYGLIFTPELDDGAATRMASAMVERRFFSEGPAVYADAITQALMYEGPLNDEIDAPHNEERLREFLRRLGAQLDALRPWPR